MMDILDGYQYLSDIIKTNRKSNRGFSDFILSERPNYIDNLPYTISAYIPSTYFFPTQTIHDTNISYAFNVGPKLKYLEADLVPNSIKTYKLNIPSSITTSDKVIDLFASTGFKNYEFVDFTSAYYLYDYKYIFYNCTELEELPNFYLSNLSSTSFGMQQAFTLCKNLTHVPSTKLDLMTLPTTINSVNLIKTFMNCTALSAIPDGIKFNKNVTVSYSNIFNSCNALSSIDNNNLFENTNDYNSKYDYMFNNCINLTTINDDVKLPSAFTMANNMFNNCTGLVHVPSGFFKNKSFISTNTHEINISNIFYNCKNITGIIDINDIYNNPLFSTTANKAFYNCTNIENYNNPVTCGDITYLAIPDSWK